MVCGEIKMIILKKNNHIDETKLDRNESIVFIQLLKIEMIRHKCQIYSCQEKMYYDIGYINSIFWNCQKENHKVDCIKIEKCINYLNIKWSLL